MISLPLDQVTISDVEALRSNDVHESKTLEYKRQAPGPTDADKVRFLQTVSAFANTAGGDLLIGVEEIAGLPSAIDGVELPDWDRERLRLEQIVGSGLEPRLPRFEMRPIPIGTDRFVIVVRIAKSWVAPHRVKANGKFYGRHSGGNYELDVGELRSAFVGTEATADRIRQFRVDRLAKIINGDTPVPLRSGGRLVLHIIPLSAFSSAQPLDLFDAFGKTQATTRPDGIERV